MTGFIVLVAYTLLMLGVSYLLTRRQTTLQGFLVGNRRMGTIKSAMSIAATWIWAPALFVSAEKAYSNGWPGLFWFLVPNILCLLFFIPYAERIRKQMPDGITISGYMGTIYRSVKVKRVYLAQLSILAVLSTAVQLLAGGKIYDDSNFVDDSLFLFSVLRDNGFCDYRCNADGAYFRVLPAIGTMGVIYARWIFSIGKWPAWY